MITKSTSRLSVSRIIPTRPLQRWECESVPGNPHARSGRHRARALRCSRLAHARSRVQGGIPNRSASGPRYRTECSTDECHWASLARLGDPALACGPMVTGTRCVKVDGFSLHANRRVKATDRKGLEKLLRYGARPPIATKRFSRLADGNIAYQLKRRWSDGSTAIVYEPLELVAKLFPLIPPARKNMVRYHGVLAPASSA